MREMKKKYAIVLIVMFAIEGPAGLPTLFEWKINTRK